MASTPDREVWSSLEVSERIDESATIDAHAHWYPDDDEEEPCVEVVASVAGSFLTLNMSPTRAREFAEDLLACVEFAETGMESADGE